MKVLFFTYAYPPLKYPRSVQIYRLVKYSRHKVQVVCCADDSPTDETIVDRSSKQPEALHIFQRKTLSRLNPRRLFGFLSVPDSLVSWARETARRVISKELVARGDVLVTFGQPMSSHIAGKRIQRETGVSWIAHFSDPWVDNPFRRRVPLSGFLNRAMERDVVESADRVVFTSDETVDLVMRKYPSSWRSKAVVIPHAFDPELYGSDATLGPEAIIRHVGNFYGTRTPEVLVNALVNIQRMSPEALRATRFELIGNMPAGMARAVCRSGLPPGRLVVRESTDYLTSLRLMREANLLLVIDSRFEQSVFLPSKLIDYIGAQRPIFAITPPGTAAELVRELGGFVADPSNILQISLQLLTAIKALREGNGSVSVMNGVRARYKAHRVTASFDALVDEVADRNAAGV